MKWRANGLMVVNLLMLQTSDKNGFAPPGPAADAALRGCQKHYYTASIDNHGIDLGADTVAGGDCDNAKLKARVEDNEARAARGNVVVQDLAQRGCGLQLYQEGSGSFQPGYGQISCAWGLRHRCRP